MLPNVPYGWLPKGKQTGILADNKRVLNIFGLLSLDQKLAAYPSTKTINSQFIANCLDDFASTIQRPTVVVLDQASWHTAGRIKQKREEWEKQKRSGSDPQSRRQQPSPTNDAEVLVEFIPPAKA